MDLLDSSGILLERNTLNKSLQSNLSQMSYNCLSSAIPKSWKKKLKYQKVDCFERWPDEIYIKIINKYVILNKVRNKQIYEKLFRKVIKPPPTAVEPWIETYPFLENHDWSKTFLLPFKVLQEPYLQCFQYKIVHRLLNCNYNLCKWNIKNSPNCASCNCVDIIQHHLFQCDISRIFWKKTEEWVYNQLDVKFSFTECEIIFGITQYSNALLEVINYVLILGKWYINNKKSNEQSLIFIDFKHTLKDKVKGLCEIKKIKGIKSESIHFFEQLCFTD